MKHLIAAEPSSTAEVNVPNSTYPKGETFLRLSAVRDRIPYSRATIYRLISENRFPRPVQLGDRAVAWRQIDIDAWIKARIASTLAVETL